MINIIAITIIGWAIIISALVCLSRRLSQTRMVIAKYDDGMQIEVKCPDCKGRGAQILGRPLPKRLGLDQGRDDKGPFFNPPQANVHACRTCNGRGSMLSVKS